MATQHTPAYGVNGLTSIITPYDEVAAEFPADRHWRSRTGLMA